MTTLIVIVVNVTKSKMISFLIIFMDRGTVPTGITINLKRQFVEIEVIGIGIGLWFQNRARGDSTIATTEWRS